jgi:hypothetical protein
VLSECARSTRFLASRLFGRGWRLLASMDVCTIACNAIATEPASFEALDDLAALNPVEIRVDRNGSR